MKIHTHIKLGFVIGLLALAHLQTKHGSSSGLIDPEIVAAVVLIVMGSMAFGNAKTEEKGEKSPFLEQNDDYDMSA